MRIVAVCGSLQKRSGNLALLEMARDAAPPGVEVVLFDGLRELPHFDPDLEGEGPIDAVFRWKDALRKSDAVLIATPEYGFSLPGALKNGIDWVIGSGELERKVVGVTAATPHPERGRRGIGALCGTLEAVSARIVGGDPIVRGPEARAHVASLVGAIADAVRTAAQE